MNNELQKFARSQILNGLMRLKPECHTLFKRMYSNKNLEADLETVVSRIPEDRLDCAMQQVIRSLEKEDLRK